MRARESAEWNHLDLHTNLRRQCRPAVDGGLTLLFAADDVLPRLIPAFPAADAWLGQMLAAAWLAVAALNWLSRSSLLGGIYARPVVVTNAVLYFVGTMVLVKVVTRPDAPAAIRLLAVPFVLFAGAYSWLLFRGPLGRDVERYRRSQQSQQ